MKLLQSAFCGQKFELVRYAGAELVRYAGAVTHPTIYQLSIINYQLSIN